MTLRERVLTPCICVPTARACMSDMALAFWQRAGTLGAKPRAFTNAHYKQSNTCHGFKAACKIGWRGLQAAIRASILIFRQCVQFFFVNQGVSRNKIFDTL